MPAWGADLTGIDFDNIKYFVRSTEKQAASWEDLPEDIKNTYDRLGIPEAEKQRLVAGVAAQYESEVVYHKIREDLEEQGVLFLDTDTALREHEDVFKEYFGTDDAVQRRERQREDRPVGERQPVQVLPRHRQHHDGHRGVEKVDLNALGGADTVTVNDLTGTDVTR